MGKGNDANILVGDLGPNKDTVERGIRLVDVNDKGKERDDPVGMEDQDETDEDVDMANPSGDTA